MTVSMRRVVFLLSGDSAADVVRRVTVDHSSQNVVTKFRAAPVGLRQIGAHGGAGDTVTLDGRLHTLFTTVTNATGGRLYTKASRRWA